MSWSPTLTPPTVSSRSVPSSACSIARERRPRLVARDGGDAHDGAPAWRASAPSGALFDSGMDAGPASSPGERSSSPVQTIVTTRPPRDHELRSDRASPRARARPPSGACARRWPPRPARQVLAGAPDVLPGPRPRCEAATTSPSRSTCSCMTTASARSGHGRAREDAARRASREPRGLLRRCSRRRRRASTGRRPRKSAVAIAYPSIALLSKRGSGSPATEVLGEHAPRRIGHRTRSVPSARHALQDARRAPRRS